jgi:DNA-binding NarL/FixJ family response regulator
MSLITNEQGYKPRYPSTPAHFHIMSDPSKSPLPTKFEDANTLAIIDDRALDRECLAQSLSAHGLDMNMELFSSVDHWKRSFSPKYAGILVNTGRRDYREKSVATEITRVIADFPDVPVIILSENHDLRQVLAALEVGVKGYIPSAMGLAVCVEAISLALAGGVFISAESLNDLHKLLTVAENKERRRAEMFTPREEEVIDALTQGKPNKIIAYELTLRESTVKVHIRNIMKKLRARNRTEVIFKINGLFN